MPKAALQHGSASAGHQCAGCPGILSTAESRSQPDRQLSSAPGVPHPAGLAADLPSD